MSRHYHLPDDLDVRGDVPPDAGRRLATVLLAAVDRAVRDAATDQLHGTGPTTGEENQGPWEPYDGRRSRPDGYAVPSYGAGGAPVAVTVRERDEVARSHTKAGILPDNVLGEPADQRVTVWDFAVGDATLPPNVTDDPAWERAMSVIVGDPSMMVAVTGFTDEAGGAAENLALRAARAQALIAAMPPAVRVRVRFSHSVALQRFLDTNSTVEGRAHNRSARVSYLSTATPGHHPADQMRQAATFDEYLYLVRTVEHRLWPADAATVLSMLRQLYYGTAAWSRTRIRFWDNVITVRPWSPSRDPAAALGPDLRDALQRSQIVEGVDVGHVLAGLDAMMHPQDVEIPQAPVALQLSNTEFATWAGDVGSAAAQ
jgi:hypothetical protein